MSTLDVYPAQKPPQTQLDAAIQKTEVNNEILDARATRRAARSEARRGHGRLAAIVTTGSLLVGAAAAIAETSGGSDSSAARGAVAAHVIEHKAGEIDPIQNGQLPTEADARKFAQDTENVTAAPDQK